MKNVLILVVSSKTYPSYLNQIFQKASWVRQSKYPVLFYFGGSHKSHVEKNNLYLKSSTKFVDMGRRTLEAFEYVNQNYDFDYILRTNNSSYIDSIALEKLVESLSSENFCGGHIGEQDKSKFISGAAYMIDKSILNLILENKDKWDHSLIDDIAISRLLEDQNVTFTNFERNDVISYPRPSDLRYDIFHTRLRLDKFKLPRAFEGLLMLKVSKNYKKFRKKNEVIDTFLDQVLFLIFRVIKYFYFKLR
jgi:hypothetical protein|tara:strand:+ start:10147 stop:10893 length:747 start_codon:yes stop_codon:yes gene_type:complete